MATGGRCATAAASRAGTPAPVSPEDRACGSRAASPAVSRLKNRLIARVWPQFSPVARIPAADPRWAGSTAPMTSVAFDELNAPMPSPKASSNSANVQYWKFTGSTPSNTNAMVPVSWPPMANGRGPSRSDQMPASGPEMRKPAVSGSMKMADYSGVRSKE